MSVLDVFRGKGDVKTLRQRAAALAARRDEVRTKLEQAIRARQLHNLEGDLTDTKTAVKLQQLIDSAQSELIGYDDALAALSTQIAAVEQQIAEEQQAVERKAASEKLDQEVSVIEAKLTPWLASTRELAALLEKQTLRFEAGAIGRYLGNAAGEVEVAANVTLIDLHHAVKAIAEGREAIPPGAGPARGAAQARAGADGIRLFAPQRAMARPANRPATSGGETRYRRAAAELRAPSVEKWCCDPD
jgi:hypothetical protein